MITKINKAQAIRNWLNKHPNYTTKYIAGQVGCDISYVQLIRAQLKANQVANTEEAFTAYKGAEKLEIVTPQHDEVNHPAHYIGGGIETIDFIKAKLTPEEFRGYCLGNTLKYLSRAGKKGGAETDLKKAQWYLARIVAES